MIRLRWLVKVDVYKQWDSRDDEYITSKYEREPELQYTTDGKKWVEVPIIYKEIKKR